MITTKNTHLELGDRICEVLTFCYSEEHRENLQKSADEMGATFEQFVAAAIASMIAERFDFQSRTNPIHN